MHACSCFKMHTESSRGPVKLVQSSLGVRKDVECSFRHCSATVMPVRTSFSVQSDSGIARIEQLVGQRQGTYMVLRNVWKVSVQKHTCLGGSWGMPLQEFRTSETFSLSAFVISMTHKWLKAMQKAAKCESMQVCFIYTTFLRSSKKLLAWMYPHYTTTTTY